MGISWYTCDNCNDVYGDCDPEARMCDDWSGGCGARFCSTSCAQLKCVGDREVHLADIEEEYEKGGVKLTCTLCRLETVTAKDLLHYLLGKYNLSHDQAVAEYRASKGA